MNYQKLAEFLGIVMGDGNLNKKTNTITIVGSLEDFYYYQNKVIPLIKSLFDVNPKLRKRNDRNAYYVDFTSKKVMNYLTNKIGLVRGNKINAEIPKLILNNKKLIPHFLRGLFDTDGSLIFSKQKKDKNYYPRLQLCFKNCKYSREIKRLLEKLDFNFGSWIDKRNLIYYHVSGVKNLEIWMKFIDMNNPVHKSKYLFWKKYGFYIPKSSLVSRINSLSLNMID